MNRKGICDFGLPPRRTWEMLSSGPLLQRVAVISYWRFGTTYRSHPEGSRTRKNDSWPLKTEPICCPETSVRNYRYSLYNDPEELCSQKECLSVCDCDQVVLFGLLVSLPQGWPTRSAMRKFISVSSSGCCLSSWLVVYLISWRGECLTVCFSGWVDDSSRNWEGHGETTSRVWMNCGLLTDRASKDTRITKWWIREASSP